MGRAVPSGVAAEVFPMTRYVIGAAVAVRLAREQTAIPDEHQLLASHEVARRVGVPVVIGGSGWPAMPGPGLPW